MNILINAHEILYTGKVSYCYVSAATQLSGMSSINSIFPLILIHSEGQRKLRVPLGAKLLTSLMDKTRGN